MTVKQIKTITGKCLKLSLHETSFQFCASSSHAIVCKVTSGRPLYFSKAAGASYFSLQLFYFGGVKNVVKILAKHFSSSSSSSFSGGCPERRKAVPISKKWLFSTQKPRRFSFFKTFALSLPGSIEATQKWKEKLVHKNACQSRVTGCNFHFLFSFLAPD